MCILLRRLSTRYSEENIGSQTQRKIPFLCWKIWLSFYCTPAFSYVLHGVDGAILKDLHTKYQCNTCEL
ncbi:hypothetical protein P3L10_030916 [Capsicum annuum]